MTARAAAYTKGSRSVHKNEATICYILGKEAPQKLAKSALLKICYFADLENVRRFGRPITDAKWRRDQYGAVAYEITNAARKIPSVQVNDYTTYTSHHGTDFWLAVPIDCGGSLSMNERAVLDDVWEQYGRRSAKELGAETKNTEPWRCAVAAGVNDLDLSVVAPRPGDELAYFARVLERVDLGTRGDPEEIAALQRDTYEYMVPYRTEACGWE